MSIINRIYAILKNSPVSHYDDKGNLKSIETYNLELTYKVKDENQNYFKYTNFKNLPTSLLRLFVKPAVIKYFRWYENSVKLRDENYFDQSMSDHKDLEFYESSFSIGHSYEHLLKSSDNLTNLANIGIYNLALIPYKTCYAFYLAGSDAYRDINNFDTEHVTRSLTNMATNSMSHLLLDGALPASHALWEGVANGLVRNTFGLIYNSLSTIGYGLSAIGETTSMFLLPLKVAVKLTEGICTLTWPFGKDQPASLKAHLFDVIPGFLNPLYTIDKLPIVTKPFWWLLLMTIDKPARGPSHINKKTGSLEYYDDYKVKLKNFLNDHSEAKNFDSLFARVHHQMKNFLISLDYDEKATAISEHAEMVDFADSTNIKEAYDSITKAIKIINTLIGGISITKLIYDPWLKLTTNPLAALVELAYNVIVSPFKIGYEALSISSCIFKFGFYSILALKDDILEPYIIKPLIFNPLSDYIFMPTYNWIKPTLYSIAENYLKPTVADFSDFFAPYVQDFKNYVAKFVGIFYQPAAQSDVQPVLEHHDDQKDVKIAEPDQVIKNSQFNNFEDDYSNLVENMGNAVVGIKDYVNNVITNVPVAIYQEFCNYYYSSDEVVISGEQQQILD